MTKGTYDLFFDKLGLLESNDNYAFVGADNELGRYQVDEAVLIATGFVFADTTPGVNDYAGRFTGRMGITGVGSFLEDAKAQDTAIEEYLELLWTELGDYTRFEGQVLNGHRITVTGLLGGAYLVGAGAMQAFLDSGGLVIPSGSPLISYLKKLGDFDAPYVVDHSAGESIAGGIGGDKLRGFGGADVLDGNAGDDLLAGGRDDDAISGGSGIDRLEGGSGDDEVHGGSDADTLFGGTGGDTMSGGDGADQIDGEGGADLMEGGNNADVLRGGDGSDSISGGDGADELDGGTGDDVLDGGDNADLLLGGDGNDHLNGGTGIDRLEGGTGEDLLQGGDGNDSLVGGAGDDDLAGQQGNDVVVGEFGRDHLNGGAGDDYMLGGDDADILQGDAGRDVLMGDAGNDLLNGGTGRDFMNGGVGDDTYVLSEEDDLIIETGRGGGDDTAIIGGKGNYAFDFIETARVISNGSISVSVESRDLERLIFDDNDGGTIRFTFSSAPEEETIKVKFGAGADVFELDDGGFDLATGVYNGTAQNGFFWGFDFRDAGSDDRIDLSSTGIDMLVTGTETSDEDGQFLLAPGARIEIGALFYENITDGWFYLDSTTGLFSPYFNGELEAANFII